MLAIATPEASQGADRYIAPQGLGLKTGDSIQDAAPFGRIDEMIAQAGAGGRVLLRADLGPYTGRYFAIRNGGEPWEPVTLSGVDAEGAEAVVSVVGSGKPFFDLFDGANHLSFVGWSFVDAGQGAFRIRGAIRGLSLKRIDGTDLRQLVDTDEEGSLTWFRFSELTSSGFSKAFIGLRNASHGLIEDCVLDSNWQDHDPIAEGIHIDGESYDITIRDVSISHVVYSKFGDPAKYWNGDGIATERDTRSIKIVRVKVDGAGDAGFDLKGGTRGEPHQLEASAATNVKRGLRVWGTTIATNVSLSNIELPSVTLEDGSVLTQLFDAGPPKAIELQSGSRLYYRNVEIDGKPVKRRELEMKENSYAEKVRYPRKRRASQ